MSKNYGYGRYRSWRYRNDKPTVYQQLFKLFGSAVEEIKNAFLSLPEESFDELLVDYELIYGTSAKKYAKKTFPNWVSGKTKLSGKTMERLIELVPPYLTPDQRIEILKKVITKHVPHTISRTVKINIQSPDEGFAEVETILSQMQQNASLSHIPENVMKAASWLYDNDITAARAMFAECKYRENEILKASARKEINLLKKTVTSKQLKSANYLVKLPSGELSIIVYEPSKCFVANVCLGESSKQTRILRNWRDENLLNTIYGRKFVVWYYNNGEKIANFIDDKILLKQIIKFLIKLFTTIIQLWKGYKFQ